MKALVLFFVSVLAPILVTAQPRIGGLQTCSPSAISGPYGYAISGYLTTGQITPFADHGNLIADGKGAFSGTTTESTGGAVATRSLTGTYSINANCTGTAVFRDSSGSSLNVAFTVVANGQSINFIQTDSGTSISGTADVATGGCDSTVLSGPYTYAISGWTAVGAGYQPFADAGRISADGHGNLSGKSTYSASGTIARRTLSGTYSIDSSCSGSAQLSDNLGNTANLSIRMINYGREVLFIETDNGTIISGRAHRGQFACTAASLSGAYSYSIEGFAINSSGIVPVADSGLITANGNGGFAGGDAISQGGSVLSRNISGSYSINADCSGSAVLSDTLGNSAALDFFLADVGSRVEFIETDPGTVVSGGAIQQAGTCTNATLSGAYGYAIEGWGVSSGVQPFADSGLLTANSGGGFTGSSTASSGGTIIRRTLSGSYKINSDCSGSATLRDNLGNNATFRLAISGDGKVVNFIETDSGTIISGSAQRQLAMPSDAVVNAASFISGALAPGSLFTIFGTNLASGNFSAGGFPLPMQLGTTTVSLNGKQIPLYAITPTQINAQLPWDVQPGAALLVVSVGGQVSPGVVISVPNAGPGLLMYGFLHVIAQNIDGSLNGPNSPARSGDTIVVYLTGGGPVQASGPLINAQPSPSGLSPVSQPFTLTIGGIPATVDYLGLTPTWIGLYQANVHVPTLPAGDHTVVLTLGGQRSNSAVLSVSP